MHEGISEEEKNAFQKVVEAIENLVAISEADSGWHVSSAIISIKLSSLETDDERYQAAVLAGSTAEAVGLGTYATTHFSQAMLGQLPE
ncbi:hypothetical protein GMA7_62 [Gordonia phage GMA7]|uniref:Uncharacterized protein n=1 Tax=Gordonia phage GMA7 TaxID=1647286 RepID=A0A0K0N6E4_9CAUD|nr:hypothetical protein AU104_gp056 [Gordonia phage GMA7]AKJ72499.1 hypothetical protein GMA7_62 [Gordonia phage GMA7]